MDRVSDKLKPTALCVICVKPNNIWMDFLRTFTHYDIYLIVDDNTADYVDKYKDFKTIHIIQIANEDCRKCGFIDMNFVIKKKIAGWEKAMYYFSILNTSYKHVWVLEEDVFIHSEQTLEAIDSKFVDGDLLSRVYTENKTGHTRDWHWSKLDIQLPPPYYKTMVCAVRMSQAMIFKIKDYASTHNTLFFLEALFPTLCKSSGLVYHTPDELKHIVYRTNYMLKDIDTVHLYHPIKDVAIHKVYRTILNKRVVVRNASTHTSSSKTAH